VSRGTKSLQDEKCFSCVKCEYSSKYLILLRTHMKSKHRIVLSQEDPLLVGSKKTKKRKLEELRYPCDKCEFSTTSLSYLKVHIKNKHEGVNYPCDRCEYFEPVKIISENISRINMKE